MTDEIPYSRRVEVRPASGGFVGLLVCERSQGYGKDDIDVVLFRSGVFPTQEDAEAAVEREREMRRKVRTIQPNQ